MTITKLCDLVDEQLVVTYYPNQGMRWCATIPGAEVKEGGMLVSHFENGVTPADAVAKYTRSIEGKTLVFNAMRPNRMELRIPMLEIP